ncbi:MAG TPA: Kiwa anti-phage protein KwaB-like domain-containing protein [Candidatus Saccharimonadales bacterium]|nr:Kiwa anti-phage protein KwaB-like domain-containing protein [Candidatus Saccharimonadales bacterium]
MDTDATDETQAVNPKEQSAEADNNALTEQVLDAEKVDLVSDTPDQERIAHKSDEEVAAAKAAAPQTDDVDIFAWANNMFQHVDQLKIDLFLLNKNNVLYRTKASPDIEKQLLPLFINPMLEFLMMGAGAGMVVRAFEDAEAEDNVLQYTKWENILRLTEVMHWLHTQEHEMEFFKEDEHDLKRIKGVIARCSHPSMKEPFYVMKVLPSAQTFKGEGAWMAQGERFVPFEAPAFRIPADNQMLVINKDVFVFNQAKLDRLFGYNAKKNSIAEQKVKEIEEAFKLRFAEGMDMQSLVKGNKATINKLQKLELGDINQDSLVDHAEEIGVDLMVDDDGAIIIEGTKDLSTFVNLLNDDYYESQLTGIKYEIRGKKPLRPPKDTDAAEIAL